MRASAWSYRGKGAALVAGALLAGSLSAPNAGAQLTAPVDCPTVMPVASVTPGMTGEGFTVSRGRTPEVFTVEVLGILHNEPLPGRNIIVVEADSAAITRARGIWAGMSGSPVYIGGELVGAVAWSFSFGPSKVAGLTPAEEMDDLLAYPSASGAGMPQQVELSAQTEAAVARETDATRTEAESGSLVRLRLPLSISGMNRGFRMFRKAMRREGLRFIPHAASAGSAAPGAPDPINAGDNFAAALSYGDITAAGIGTATLVCENKALAFGHPFFFDGDTLMGASNGEAITVIDDPTFGPYKLANVDAGPQGSVDQDRLAGIRALLGEMPETIPITSFVEALNTGRARNGRTDAVLQDLVPSLTFTHAFTNIDSAFDEIGEGSARVTWRVDGVTASGAAWGLDRTNSYTSRYDISFGSLFELLDQLYVLRDNDFEEIEFTAVDLDIQVDDVIKQYKIVDVLVSKTESNYRDVRSVRARRGDTIYLRVELEPYDGTANVRKKLDVKIPRRDVRDGTIFVQSAGASFDTFCFFRPRRCGNEGGGEIESFQDLVRAMEDAPTNNQLEARLRLGRRVRDRDQETLDLVVKGSKRIEVNIVR
jgi:hypothetical protein